MASAHPVPDAALDDRLAIVGTSGSGKTYAAKGMVETLLTLRHRVVIVDPLDVWFGLRLLKSGTGAAFPVAILGGRHADLPLNEHSGAVIGEAVARSNESCIVSLTGLKTSAARQRFMLAFLDALYERTDPDARDPYHVLFDEADLWAPQKPMGQEAMLAHLMEEIVRRGRVKGFIPWLITQRPAVLNKNVLSQADGLIAMKLTASQDRKALAAWVQSTADEGQWAEIDKQLPTFGRGHGVVWLPGHGILRTVAFPENHTFDSSRTPKRGEKKHDTALKPLDLGALKEKLATVEAESKANDPAALKAEIAKLKRELAQRDRGAAPAAPDPQAIAAAEQRARAAGFELGRAKGQHDGYVAATKVFDDAFEHVKAAQERADRTIGDLHKTLEFIESRTSPPAPIPALEPRARKAAADPASGKPLPAAGGNGASQDEGLTGPQQRMLDVIAFWNSVGYHAPTREQVAAVCGYSIKASTFRVVAGALKTGGYIEYPDSGKLMLTPKGRAIARPLGADESKRKLESVLSGAQIKVVGILRDAGGRLPRADLISRAGYSEAASTHRVVIGGLKTLEVVDYPERGVVELSRWASEVLAA